MPRHPEGTGERIASLGARNRRGYGWAIRYRELAVRMNRLSRSIAGDAMVNSSSTFLPITLNSGPAWIT